MGDAGSPGVAELDELELPGPAYYPESLSISADGTLYVGSLGTGAVMKFAPGQRTATPFIAAGGNVKGVAGVLVDAMTNSLIICAVDGTFMSVPTVQRYDLTTGALKATFSFPGAGGNPYVGFPNDLAFDGTHRLFVTDSFGGKLYVVPDISADATMTAWVTDAALGPAMANTFGADGISFDGSAALYVNNNNTGKVVKIAINGDGTAGAVTVLTLTPALSHPDGQRQLDANTLAIVDNDGSLVKVAIAGTAGTVTPIANRLEAPTAVVKLGGYYWVSEGQITTSLLTGMTPHLPFYVRRIAAY
jgi:hypothetical protein